MIFDPLQMFDRLQISALLLIVATFLVALTGIKKKQGGFAQFAAIAPNILTSEGIFFTFLGILISLFNFDVSYREHAIIGRPLQPEEVQYFSETARRIAAILKTAAGPSR